MPTPPIFHNGTVHINAKSKVNALRQELLY